MMLYKLLSATDKRNITAEVISLTDIGPVGKKIEGLGIPAHALGMSRGVPSLAALFKLIRLLKETKPDVIQSWMYHADLLAGVAAKLAGGIPVVWGIRQSDLSPAASKKSTILTAKICAFASGYLPKKIICCSEASARVHAELGYSADKMLVIPNGFNLKQFKPDMSARDKILNALGIDEGCFVIGLVGRFDPQKDHYNFIKAAEILLKNNAHVQFLLCGDGIDESNFKLMEWIEQAGIKEHVHLLGRRDDISELNSAMDISSSSSFGEGFPNVIGEAMACATPCVVTDVGDSALIVGDAGLVVAPRAPGALAAAWEKMIDMGEAQRQAMGFKARERIMEKFSLPKIALRYEQLYQSMDTE
ncbi:MAG TPA: glycosyltransferase [Pseudomonadales bacterium]